MDFKKKVELYDNPNVWGTPGMIIQQDSLLNLLFKNSDVMDGEGFAPSYDLIVLGASKV